MKYVLITGSSGLIGSQSVDFFHRLGYGIIGIDNNMREYFFGSSASTQPSRDALIANFENYIHFNYDIRDIGLMETVFEKYGTSIDLVIHTASQPSHDWAAKEPITDFTINALGTLNLLELTRKYCYHATFIFTSTNKVYGDTPNYLNIVEQEKRYECFGEGNSLYSIPETMSIDQTKHSVFGASKVSADVMCQEYGKYFGLKTGIFRGGCLTGPNHAGTELHGFLSYLVKCMVENKPYTIFGYKGKQVRDNIHSYDLVNMFWHFHQNPQCGEVYNVGGGRSNSCSILEAIDAINEKTGFDWKNYSVSNSNRIGDHIWYITDFSKFKSHYPNWNITKTLDNTLDEMINFEINKERLHDEAHQPHEKHLPYPQPWEFVYAHFFSNVKNKFFIDVGASNGLDGSNSSLFEFYLNWNGICIEPNIVQYNKLIKNRNCKTYNCCIGNTDTIKEFWEIQGSISSLSGLKETYDSRHIERLNNEVSAANDVIIKKDIEVKKLSTIMNENNITHVDYLSIDVEGAELQVLEGIDFDNHYIDVISLEDNGHTDKTKEFLLNKNYKFVTKICCDMIFKKRI